MIASRDGKKHWLFAFSSGQVLFIFLHWRSTLCLGKKSKPQTILDRYVKSQHIVTKLRVPDFEYVFEIIAEFH